MLIPLCKKDGDFLLLIEHDGSKILFDTGGDPASFFSNAERLQLSLSEITHLVFSHRHWDHIAGFKEIAKKMGKGTSLYVPKTFPWLLLKSGSARFAKTKIVHAFEEIAPNVYALVLRGGFWLYELSLVIKTPKGSRDHHRMRTSGNYSYSKKGTRTPSI